MTFDKEMQKALEADGEKLRQLTGEDHGPVFMADAPEVWEQCPDCQGEGCYEKAQPFHDDPYFCVVVICETCGGAGGAIRDAS